MLELNLSLSSVRHKAAGHATCFILVIPQLHSDHYQGANSVALQRSLT